MKRDAAPSMKYAHVERERRFLVDGRPDLTTARRIVQIHDRYILGTRMRLRVADEIGQDRVWKLGQKVPLDSDEVRTVAHTTMYLDRAEHDRLAGLPALALAKTRHLIPLAENWVVAVDVFHGKLTGLVLAEVDLESEGVLPMAVIPGSSTDVTDVDAFTGRALAELQPDGLSELLEGFAR